MHRAGSLPRALALALALTFLSSVLGAPQAKTPTKRKLVLPKNVAGVRCCKGQQSVPSKALASLPAVDWLPPPDPSCDAGATKFKLRDDRRVCVQWGEETRRTILNWTAKYPTSRLQKLTSQCSSAGEVTLLTTSGGLRCQDRWRRPPPGTPEDVVYTPLTSLWEPKSARVAASWREFTNTLQSFTYAVTTPSQYVPRNRTEWASLAKAMFSMTVRASLGLPQDPFEKFSIPEPLWAVPQFIYRMVV